MSGRRPGGGSPPYHAAGAGVSGCRDWMDGAERMDAKLAEDAADNCEAGDGGTREPPGAAPDRSLGFAFSALICCRTAFR